MKKIIISSYDELKNPYYAGGGAVAIHEVAKRLANTYQITIVCGKYPKYKDYTKDGVTYMHVGLSVKNPKIAQLLFMLSLPFVVLNQSFDLWLESFTPPFSTALLPLFTKKPVIGLVHMLSGEDMRRKYLLPFDFFEQVGLKFYNNFIVLTEENKRKIKRVNKNAQIVVIPNGVHITTQKSSIEKHILFIGRIEVNQKGLDLLLEAYKKAAKKIQLPLIIAGAGTENEINKLKRLIKDLSLEKEVNVVGKATGSAKEKLYKEAKLIIVPSRFETFSLVALEALAYKKPLVTFPIKGLQWIPTNAKIMAKKIQSNDLATAMDIVNKDNLLRQHVASAGYTFAKNFSWPQIAKKYNAYIRSLLN